MTTNLLQKLTKETKKYLFVFFACFCGLSASAATNRFPILRGLLQGDLNANTYAVTNANWYSSLGSNTYYLFTNAPAGGGGGTQTNISWVEVTNLQSAQVPITILTNASLLTNGFITAAQGTNIASVQAQNVTNAVGILAITAQQTNNLPVASLAAGATNQLLANTGSGGNVWTGNPGVTNLTANGNLTAVGGGSFLSNSAAIPNLALSVTGNQTNSGALQATSVRGTAGGTFGGAVTVSAGGVDITGDALIQTKIYYSAGTQWELNATGITLANNRPIGWTADAGTSSSHVSTLTGSSNGNITVTSNLLLKGQLTATNGVSFGAGNTNRLHDSGSSINQVTMTNGAILAIAQTNTGGMKASAFHSTGGGQFSGTVDNSANYFSSTRNDLRLAPSEAFILQNAQAATAAIGVQDTPAIRWQGNVWNTNAAASQRYDFFMFGEALTNDGPQAFLTIRGSINSGAAANMTNVWSLDVLGNTKQKGQLTATNGVQSYGGITDTQNGVSTVISSNKIYSGGLNLTGGGTPGTSAGIGQLWMYDSTPTPKLVLAQNAGGQVEVSSEGFYAFSSTTLGNGVVDIKISRNAAGVLEINNGTAGNLTATLKTGTGIFTNTISATNGVNGAWISATLSTNVTTAAAGTNAISQYNYVLMSAGGAFANNGAGIFTNTLAGNYCISFGAAIKGGSTDNVGIGLWTNNVKFTGLDIKALMPAVPVYETGFKEVVILLPALCAVELRCFDTSAANAQDIINVCLNIKGAN